jgi:tRNA pseudouridine32 synthase/23S rRNA pseudouridine746 synthase
MPGPEPQVVFEHPDFFVLDKPAGWTVQRDDQAHSVLEWLNENDHCALPTHRLDKPTTGLLLVARNVDANQHLSVAFAERSVKKTYLAVSDQKPKKKQGWVKGDMAPSRRSQWKLLRSQENPAITSFTSMPIENGLRGFVLSPRTGKTHQLRVAMKSLGSPIFGDTLYGGSSADRMYLHAWRLEFTYQDTPFHFQCLPKGQWFERWLSDNPPE